MTPLLWGYILASLLALCLYGIDKVAARRNWRRIRESTLHLVALVGGWPGALLGRHWFRHKTRKQPFGRILWACVAANIAVSAWLILADSAAGVRQLSELG
ncbi:MULTISPECIES: DUF1294 domain-containing protein [unclassified Halomonas]|uniref:DUF1294 domain-containing protein n=1 Tax=unclassified Halomonas TaxID=2609666 RepID=UPI002883C281|nr:MULTISPECIES: DUF1294 domain-containing protein [unclassified Halomonas]MDT0500598.1 DUF1294 domain-containing protein [Halomonas sp. PAR7]MDT0511506.1 DUF1294 domain-containing protein [Halomonas sp. LES1]MDT0590206.1 DUF1294 domain-containing protein [Halomonas sp. PAR8]